MPWTVNGEPLDDSVIRQEARLLHAQLVEAAPEDDALTIQMRAWEWARENVIERVLLRQAALQNPAPLPDGLLEMAIQDFASQPGRTLLGDGPHFERELEIQLRVQRLTSALTSSVAPISNEEVGEYYRKHRDSFFAPEMVHAAHIVKNVDERADTAAAHAAITAAQSELRAGKSFGQVADELSDCPGRGGDLGWIAPGQMVDEFEAVVFRMRAGEVSEIFKSPFGFHIAKVNQRRRAGSRPIEEVREVIANAILTSRREAAVNQFVDALRSRAEIRKT